MKLNVLLVVSLALNALGAGLVLLGRPTAALAPTVVSRPAPTPSTQPPTIDADVWPSLETNDLPALIGRLEASGFPPEHVRAIVAAQIREHYAARRNALQPSTADRAFWKEALPDPKARQALLQLDREQRKQMRELFGDADADDPLRGASSSQSLGFLPLAKSDEIRRVNRDFEERRADVFADAAFNAPTYEKLKAIDKERDAAIAQLLTPEELHEYQLRNSPTAVMLRDQLSAFNPTEEEFRALFRLRQSFDDRFPENSPVPVGPDDRRARAEAEKLLNEQIKAALAPERAAEYERSTDFNYRRTSQLVARLELPPETTSSLWAVQKEFEQRGREIVRSAPPDEDRNQRFVALQSEAIARLTPLLGSPQNVDAYKQYGGQWLDSMIPRTRRTLTK